MKQYKVGHTYEIEDVKGYVESHPHYYADLGRPNQAAIRDDIDVVAEFYLEGDTAKCIYNIYDDDSPI